MVPCAPNLAVLLGLAKGVGLAANAEAGVGASVWQGGRQRHEGNEGEEGLESGKGDGFGFSEADYWTLKVKKVNTYLDLEVGICNQPHMYLHRERRQDETAVTKR